MDKTKNAATYPVSVISKLLMISERRVQQLTTDGVIPKADRGRYELAPAVQGYIKFLRDRAIAADTVGGDDDHKRRLIKARADIAEMESERISGSLVEVKKVEKTWTDIMSRVRPKLLSIAPKSAAVVAVETSADACHKIIQKSVDEALIELSSTHIETEIDEEEQASRTEAIIDGDSSGAEGSITASDSNG